MTMQKTRNPLCAAYAVARAIELVGVGHVSTAVDRSEKTVYDWADEDRPGTLSVEQALAVDAVCLKKVGESPFTDLFDRQRDALKRAGDDVLKSAVRAAEGATSLVREALEALDPLSEGGRHLSRNEKARLSKRIGDVIGELQHAQGGLLAEDEPDAERALLTEMTRQSRVAMGLIKQQKGRR